jgi:NAD(P)-dependent dehydrogenase (short-subunit alcohol dehydrogenase family)
MSSVAATRSGASVSKTIVVTGGSRGIGRAVALGAGALGWSVGVGYRDDRSAADEVIAAIEGTAGVPSRDAATSP